MPETAVNEDDLFEAGEHHIRLAGEVFAMQAEAVAHPMNYGANEQFGLCVFIPNLRHIE